MDDQPFQRLTDELDAWAADGREATFWWRDDDAIDISHALDRLLDLQSRHAVPVGLAVVPMEATRSLAARVSENKGVTALQHGYAHRNYATHTEKKIELGAHRRADHVIAELAMGWQQIETLFGDGAVPALVPPWNRMAPYLTPLLPELGYTGLSIFTPRTKARPVAGLDQVNTHADIMNWDPSRGFAGANTAIDRVIEHLAARRRRDVPDPDEPTGILTHHLVHDATAWQFLDRLFGQLNEHGAARWLSPASLFGGAGAGAPTAAGRS